MDFLAAFFFSLLMLQLQGYYGIAIEQREGQKANSTVQFDEGHYEREWKTPWRSPWEAVKEQEPICLNDAWDKDPRQVENLDPDIKIQFPTNSFSTSSEDPTTITTFSEKLGRGTEGRNLYVQHLNNLIENLYQACFTKLLVVWMQLEKTRTFIQKQILTVSKSIQQSPFGQKSGQILNASRSKFAIKKNIMMEVFRKKVVEAKGKLRDTCIDIGMISPSTSQEQAEKLQRQSRRLKKKKLKQKRRKGSKIVNDILRYDKERLFYKMLGVRKTCTADQLKRAYRKRSLTVHPDKNADERAHEAFDALRDAYELLADSALRLNYDDELKYMEKMKQKELKKKRERCRKNAERVLGFLAQYIHVITATSVILFFFML